MKNVSPHARVRARRNAVQALYQWLITDTAVQDIISEFETDRKELKKADTDYFKELLLGTEKYSAELETILRPYIDREIEQLDPIERAILNLGAYELKYQTDLPVNIVINESIELAKMFGAEESHKYVNGVLDQLAKAIR